MPAVVAALPTVAATIFGTAGSIIGTGIGAAIFAGFAQTVLFTGLSRLIAGKPAPPSSALNMAGRTVTVTSSVETAKIVYGETRVGGSFVHFDAAAIANGTDYIWFVVCLADHVIDSFVTIWLDDEPIDVATEIDGSGFVTNPKFVSSDGVKLVKIRMRTGGHSAAVSDLVSEVEDWTDQHIGRNRAYMAIRCQVDRSKGGSDVNDPDANVWHAGLPRSFSATIRGKKVYDPRDGSQSLSNPNTWKWSNNPALCWADYMIDKDLGVGENTSRINYTAVAAAANACEESVNVWNAAGNGSTSQQRYNCNGVLDTAFDHDEALQRLLSAMSGSMVFVSGKYEPRAGVWSSPIDSYDESDLAGEYQTQHFHGLRDVYNTVKGTYVHQLRGYEEVEFATQTDAAYVSADGFTEDRDIALPFTDDEYRAQWIARLALRQSRNQATFIGGFKLRACLPCAGDTIQLTLADEGWNAKTFRVDSWRLEHDRVVMALTEDNQSAYAMTDHTQLTKYVPAPPVEKVTALPRPPTNLAAVGTSQGIVITWSNPGDMRGVTGIDVVRTDTSALPGSPVQIITTTFGEQFIDPVPAGETKWYRVRTRFFGNKTSEYAGPVSAQSGLADSLSTNTGHANLLQDPDFTRTALGTSDERFWFLQPGGPPRTEIVNQGIDGKRCAKLTHGPNLGSQATLTAVHAVPLHKGQTVTITVAARLDSGASGSIIIQLHEVDADGVGTALQQQTSPALSTSEWRHVSASFVASGTNTVGCQVTIFDLVGPNQSLRINDVIAYYGGAVSELMAVGTEHIEEGAVTSDFSAEDSDGVDSIADSYTNVLAIAHTARTASGEIDLDIALDAFTVGIPNGILVRLSRVRNGTTTTVLYQTMEGEELWTHAGYRAIPISRLVRDQRQDGDAAGDVYHYLLDVAALASGLDGVTNDGKVYVRNARITGVEVAR